MLSVFLRGFFCMNNQKKGFNKKIEAFPDKLEHYDRLYLSFSIAEFWT